jgi:beta-lactamase regulating signal transducer with metallopeptidase domain
MTALGVQIIWLAVRVTGIGLLAAVLARWSVRRAARSTVQVLACAVAVNLALGIAAFCPAPDFGRWSMLVATPSSDDRIAEMVRGDAEWTDHDAPAAGISVAGAWRLLTSLSRQPAQSPAWQQTGTVVAVLYGLGVAIAGLRLLSGLLAVRSLRRSSRPIHDGGLLQLADALRNTLGCSRHVELQECREPGLAATTGWWRPVIFLPPEWPEWTEAERKAVLAHELAHICYGDYLIGLATRLCHAVYFYHPLVRWLSNQLGVTGIPKCWSGILGNLE